jgi:uncharacterized protein (DUF4213/DUF364 family)
MAMRRQETRGAQRSQKVETISCEPGAILRETVEEIRAELGSTVESLSIERVVIGLFFTGVKLSNGAGGLCFTPLKSIPEAVCCPTSVRAMPNSGQLRGRPVLPFVEEMLHGSALNKALGIAAINALSMTCWKVRPPASYEIKTGLDAMDEVTIQDDDYVIVVGAFVPVLKLLKRRAKPFGILELNLSVLFPEELPFLISPEQRDEKISQADLIIATGTTLINDTLEGLLQHKKSNARVVVMGPTASCLPEAFFRRGVNLVGGVRVADPDRVLDITAEAGSGFHFFDKGADRIVIQPLSRPLSQRG